MWMLVISIAWFLAALVLHVIVWRIRVPRAQTTALLKLFGGCYLLAMLIFALSPGSSALAMNPQQLIYFSIFYLPSALTYTSFYSLIEHDSPSVQIVMALDRAGEYGVTREELMAVFGNCSLVDQRLQAAKHNGLLQTVDGGWVLTTKGRSLAQIFDLAARIYRFDRAG